MSSLTSIIETINFVYRIDLKIVRENCEASLRELVPQRRQDKIQVRVAVIVHNRNMHLLTFYSLVYYFVRVG